MEALIEVAAHTYVQQQLVLFLREYFAKLPDTFFRWTSNPATTKIRIGTEYDEKRMQIPSIIVGDVSGDLYNRVLGQEMITEIKEKKEINGVLRNVTSGYRLHGIYTLKCKIDIHSYQVGERRRLADLTSSAIRHIGINTLKPKFIDINSCDLGIATVRNIGNQLLQVTPINLGLVTQWNMTVTDLTQIKKILIESIETYTKDTSN